MADYIHDDYLLQGDAARRLYHEFAQSQPIFDFHCHLSPKEIYEDKSFPHITDVWLSGDHYKWRLMRACGVPEKFVTGDGDPYEKFLYWAGTVEKSVGNPLYAWTHLELKRYFGVSQLLNTASAPAIWEQCNRVLAQPGFSARGLILRSGVKALCTTDDPADDLRYHQLLREDESFPVRVLPAFRPENALHPETAAFLPWIDRMEAVTGRSIDTLAALESALLERAEFFKENGCLIADQSLQAPDFARGTREEAEAAFRRARAGEALSPDALNAYQSQLMRSLGKIYRKMGFVMQLHFGVLRNVNSRMYSIAGADAGFDSVGDGISAASVAALFDALDRTDELPKTVVYSLNGGDDDKLAAVLGCFQEGCFPQKMQLGTPWWFSDHRDGMEKMLKALANTGLLSGFIGMLTDSRSFLSYARHEYFRRVLCNLLGGWMERGEIPGDFALVGSMVKDICFGNAARYFGL